MVYPFAEQHYLQTQYYPWNNSEGSDMEQTEESNERSYLNPGSGEIYRQSQAYGRDYLDEEDLGAFENETDMAESIYSPSQRPEIGPYMHSDPSLSHSQQLSANLPPTGLCTGSPGVRYPPSNASPLVSTQPVPQGHRSNPPNSHRIQLKPVSILPDMYRSFFKFGVFNAIQSQCYDTMINSQSNTVISAPTGSGKTVLFELALIRMLMNRDSHHMKCVYMAPTKALCSERFRDWSAKLDPIGIKCCELTGDTVGYGRNALGDAKLSSVIITTPEKFDSLSRNWRDHGDVLSRTQLFLIDEVHILNESRGSTLEVVASRMKIRGTSVRFVLVSATVPNIDDIATWIGSGSPDSPASVFNFGEEFRPCRLTRVVYGYPRNNQNDFSFSRTLDYKLLPLLQQHAANKPVLVFCATRKGVVGTAEVLMREYQKLVERKQTVPWVRPKKIEPVFHDSQLQELAAVGVGVHHAGLTLDDRRMTEDLFLKKIIQIVVATSTLAPVLFRRTVPAAHTVVIKGVKMWQNGGWREYSDLDFIQMIGRAGRPQFDKEGVAVILCDTEQERKYKALVSGSTLLESCLHVNLSEHLNSEIGLGTITNLNTAQAWLRNSFLFQRIQKNPRHYGLGKASGQTWQSRLDELVDSSIRDLQKSDLVTNSGIGDDFTSTEYGDIMSKYYIRLSTMKSILKLSDKSNLREILELVSTAEEIGDLRLRAGEKQIYKKMSDHNDIRFRTKIEKASDKIFIIIQAVLGGISLNSPEYKTADSQPFLEALSIFKHAARISRTIVEVAIVKRLGSVLKYGMELYIYPISNAHILRMVATSVRSLTAKAWEDRPMVLRQIEQIGEKSIKVLAQNGIATLAALRLAKPTHIELLLNRRPPFGDSVIAAARELPQYSLKITEASILTCGGDKPVTIELKIECGLADISETTSTKNKKNKRPSLGMTAVLTLTSDNEFVDFRRIPTKALRVPKSFLVTVTLTKPSQSVSTRISPDDYAGLTVTEIYRPSIPPQEYPTLDTRPASYDVDEVLAGLEEDPTFWDFMEEDPSTDEPPRRDSGCFFPTGCLEVPGETRQTLPKKKKNSKAKEIGKLSSTGATKGSTEYIKLPNGNYACNHTCKRKNQCRHLCCRDGLSKPPKKTTPAAPSEQSMKPLEPMAVGVLKHLESPYQKSGGLELSHGRQLKLDSGRLKPKKLDRNKEQVSEADESDNLPDPHEIIYQPDSTVCQNMETYELTSDSDSSVPPGSNTNKHESLKLNLGKLASKPAIESVSTNPLKSKRQSTTGFNETLSSPPAMKRQRLSTHQSNIKPLVDLPLSAKQNLTASCESKLPATDITKPTAQGKVALFLGDDLSSDQPSQTNSAAHGRDESFTLNPDLFDVEPSAMSSTSFPPKLTDPPNKSVPAPQPTFCMDEELTLLQDKGGIESSTELNDYDQGIAELRAWLYSGAVEITDQLDD